MKARRITYECIGAVIFIALGLLLCCSASAQQQQKPGDVWKDPALGMEFVWVPGGCYEMGCKGFPCLGEEYRVHTVCVSGFWMGRYEVTQGQWRRLMGDNPAKFKGCGDNCPVEMVSWDEAVEFARRLSQRGGYTFRLPTEAEWEYACRSGGREEKYSGGDNADAVAWYDDNSGKRTHLVGQKRSNGLGIYDMSGNVWEWCSDFFKYNYYGSSPRNNPQGPASGSERVIRGGSWVFIESYVRCAFRNHANPADRVDVIGFRLVRVGRQ